MGNEMGNRNVSGLQEEEKAMGEDTEKNLVGGERGDELKGENHVVPDVKDKDFHEKVDELSGGEVLGDGDSLVEKKITDEKGQEDDTNESRISSQLVDMEAAKESDDDKPMLYSNFEGDKLIQDQITIGRETEETETKGSTVDSTSPSKEEKCEVEHVDDNGNGFQVIGSTDELMGLIQEPKLLVKDSAQEENCEVARVDEDVNGFLLVGSLDSSQEVCEPFAQETELMAKDGGSQEEKCEVASVVNEGIGFPLVGLLDSSQEVCEPFAQETELMAKDGGSQEEKCEVASVVNEGIGFPLVGSLDSSQEVCEPFAQETELMAKDGGSQEEKCEVASVVNEGIGFPLVGSLDSSQEVCEPFAQETELMAKDGGSQEEKCEVASVVNEGIGFPLVGSLDSSQEVCEPFAQETELMAKDGGSQEEKCEVASVVNEGIGFPLVGSLDSSQEMCEPFAQETELMAKDGGSQEEKCEVASVVNEGIGFQLVGSLDSSQEVCEPFAQETELVAKDGGSQEEKCEVANVVHEGTGLPLVGSLDSSQEVCEPLDKLMDLTQEPELLVKEKAAQEEKCEVESVDEDGNGFTLAGSLDSSQEVLEPQDKSIGLPQEEGKCDTTRVNGNGNGFLMVGLLLSSQEVCDPQEKSIGLTQEPESIVKESGSQEEKCGVGSLDEEGNGFPLFGSVDSSQEVSEPREVTVIVHELLAVPTELTVTDENCQENKSTEEIVEGNVSQSPHKGNTKTSPEGEKITTNKNLITIVERKSPSFDFDLSLEAKSQDSDRTPLLCYDKAATRSLSSRGQQTYQYSKVPLEDEAVSVEEKTIMMERSYSEKSRAPFMSLLKKEEKGSIENPEKEEGNVGGYKKAEKEVMLSSGKGSNGKRKPVSSFFATCICCDASIL